MLRKTTKGAALGEFGLLVGLVAVVAIGAVKTTGTEVRDIFTGAASDLADATAPGTEAGSEASGTLAEPAPPPEPVWTCGVDGVDIDGVTYGTVEIGAQCWTKENLNIATASSLCYGGMEENCTTYGRLYSFAAPAELVGLCPSGWHMSTDRDWIDMEVFLGMNPDDAETTNRYRETGNIDQYLADWTNMGTNSSGFTMLAGGYVNAGSYVYAGDRTLFITDNAEAWRLFSSTAGASHRRTDSIKNNKHGYARCVMD